MSAPNKHRDDQLVDQGEKLSSREVRLQQLRSFCETAKHGSQTAAAKALGLTQPTIGEQVHALERELGEKLIESHGRGCRLTEGGAVLAELAGPLVAGIDSLKASFFEARRRRQSRLTVASSPRILAEDVPDCLAEFEKRFPLVQVTCLELNVEDVLEAVKSGRANFGLTLATAIHADTPWIVREKAYELDFLLTMRTDHPLARQKTVTLEDLGRYPVVNSPNAFPDPAVREVLIKAGVFNGAPRRIEASYTAAVRKFVRLGYGIGLVLGIADFPDSEGLVTRSLTDFLGRAQVDVIRRNGALLQDAAVAFAQTIKSSIERKRADSARRARSGGK